MVVDSRRELQLAREDTLTLTLSPHPLPMVYSTSYTALYNVFMELTEHITADLLLHRCPAQPWQRPGPAGWRRPSDTAGHQTGWLGEVIQGLISK